MRLIRTVAGPHWPAKATATMTLFDDIAERVGVSRSTVKRILAGGADYRRPTLAARAERILEIAEEMGYRRNAAAKATSTGRFNTVALIHRADTDFFPFELLRGIQDGLAPLDQHLVVARLEPDEIRDTQRLPRVLSEWCVDGLLIHEAKTTPDSVIEVIRRHRIPTVWLNTNSRHDTVHPDEFTAVRDAVRHLIALGHRRIACCDFRLRWGDEPLHFSLADREAGYQTAMTEAGLAPRVLREEAVPIRPLEGFWGGEGDRRLAQATALLRGRDRPTAVVALNNDVGGAVLQAATALGLRVPADLSLLVIHHEGIHASGVCVSVLATPFRQLGMAGVRMLIAKQADPKRGARSVVVPYEPIAGRTVAEAPAR